MKFMHENNHMFLTKQHRLIQPEYLVIYINIFLLKLAIFTPTVIILFTKHQQVLIDNNIPSPKISSPCIFKELAEQYIFYSSLTLCSP